MPDTPAGWLGYALAAITIIVAWFRDRRKADVDESTLILGKWKELVEQHEKTLAALNGEIAGLRDRLNAAEGRIRDLEEERRGDRRRIADLENENAGLKRAIAQNSRSAAVLLPPTTPTSIQETADAAKVIDKAITTARRQRRTKGKGE